MYVIHLEHIVSRSQHHLVFFGQNHRLQYIYHLSNVGHFNSVGIFMEDIQTQRSHEGIAQGILLVKMTADSTRFFIPPGSPFVYHQANLLFRVIFVHNGNVTLEHIFNFAAFSHRPIIIFVVELRSRTFASTPSKHSIIVQRKSVHAMTYVFHQHFSPVIVIIAGTAGNLEQAVAIVVTAISRITAIQIGIVFRTHATSASPAFISHSEVFYFPRFFTSVFQTQFCHRASLFRSHIFYPLGHFFHATATYVSADVGFTS